MAKLSSLMEPMILESSRLPCAEEAVEIVERKGLGHPDTICDAVMERVAVELTQAYVKTCGHVNADKGMLVAVGPQIEREVQLAFAHIKPFCQALTRGLYAVC